MGRNRKAERGGEGKGNLPGVVVNGHSTEWLRKDFPWVYPAEVVRVEGRPLAGRQVSLRGSGGEHLGVGIWDDGWIAVRRFRLDDGPVDEAWLHGAVQAALARRRGLIPPSTNAWRVVHGENDGLPGVRVDSWGDHLSVTLDSPGLSGLLPPLASVLEGLLDPATIVAGWRRDPRDKGAGGQGEPSLLLGAAPPGEVTVEERGVRFLVRPGAGADTGLFTDMRENRAFLDRIWDGRSVLNLFAYTGAFSVFAALHGATDVTSVDLSRPSLERARCNFEVNGLTPGALEEEDVSRFLDRARRKGSRFDVVLIDPPPFSHGPGGTFSISKDLRRLVAASLRVLAPGGFLAVASNQGTHSPRAFQEDLLAGARKARRELATVFTGTQAPDFPSALSFPEGRYLKFQVLVS